MHLHHPPAKVNHHWVYGRASRHGYLGYTTAARGGRRGDVLIVEDLDTGRRLKVRVVDACGRRMRPSWGRVLDLSDVAFRKLHRNFKPSSLRIRYKVVSQGSGSPTGRF